MTGGNRHDCPGFTLIELLTALLVLSILALLSHRGLNTVLDARSNVAHETAKWRDLGAFFSRFERDIQLAEPRVSRRSAGESPPWQGSQDSAARALLEFSRAGSIDGLDTPRRNGYRLNDRREVELLTWPGLDLAPGTEPERHVVLSEVEAFQVQYMNDDRNWIDIWPSSPVDPPLPRAIRLRVLLSSGEEIQRVFAVKL